MPNTSQYLCEDMMQSDYIVQTNLIYQKTFINNTRHTFSVKIVNVFNVYFIKI